MKERKGPAVFELPIELTPAQQVIHDSPARFKVIKAGKRFGKSKYGIFWQLSLAAAPYTNHWYVAPTYSQAKMVAWMELLGMIPSGLILRKHETELWVMLKNYTKISLKGADQPDNLRGPGIHSLVMEEAAYQKPYVWTNILRSQLADNRGPALFISSPNGNNWFEKLYQYALVGSDKEWAGFHYTIFDNPHITRDEIEKIRRQISESVWRQEFMAEAVSSIGLVYPEFDEGAVVVEPESLAGMTAHPLVLGGDWGFDDDTAMIWLHVEPLSGKMAVTDEHVQNGWHVQKHASIIRQMMGGRRLLPGHFVLDCSAFRDEPTSGTSIARQFHKEGLTPLASSRDPNVGIDVVKRCLFGDGERPWLAISRRCKRLISALREWEYGQHEPDAAAALRYALTHVYRRRLSPVFNGMETFESARHDEAPMDDLGRRILKKPSLAIAHSWEPDLEDIGE